METLKISLSNGKGTAIDSARLDDFANAFRGELIQPGDKNYDEARTIWNAMIDRKPALIARCYGPADVITAVNFARDNGLLISVKSIGHNIAGNAVCDGGLMIDLSQMRSCRVDPLEQTAHVEPGVTLGDFDHEAQAHGLVTPLGINSTTGVAGLTLGGGFGWLSRKYGMTIDNLKAADVVTADGRYLRTSEKENQDLFWGIRGGGGNFGIVTRFEFQLHPLKSNIFSGLVVFPMTEAVDILKKYREFVKNLGDESTVWVVLREAPPLPFLPDEVHGTNVLVLALFHDGDAEEAKKLFKPLWSFGTVLGEFVGEMPYQGWQTAFDPLLTEGARNYWKSHNFFEMSDELIGLAVDYASKLPSPQCEIFFGLLGKAVNRIAPDATAYPHRDVDYVMNVHARWDNAEDDKKCIKWARDYFSNTEPYSQGGVYINFMTEDEAERVGSAYGSSYDRMVDLKKKYDPQNLFRMNQNIDPSK